MKFLARIICGLRSEDCFRISASLLLIAHGSAERAEAVKGISAFEFFWMTILVVSLSGGVTLFVQGVKDGLK